MSRALLLLAVLAVLTAPALAQSISRGRRGSYQGRSRGRGLEDNEGRCPISRTVTTGAFSIDGATAVRPTRPDTYLNGPDKGEPAIVPDHPMTLASAKAFVENQPAPPVLDHYTTTYDCVDSR